MKRETIHMSLAIVYRFSKLYMCKFSLAYDQIIRQKTV